MKSFYLLLMLVLFGGDLTAQTITGKVVNESEIGLQYYNVQIYITPNVFSSVTDSNGYFVINLTEVKEETLPKDYTISNNYPNPFNPRTRIDFSLPQVSKIKVEIFNTIGQNVGQVVEKEMQAGNNYIDLELNGLPNGVYFARINVNDKYNVVRKLMLLYGSQHLSNSILNNEQYLSKDVNFAHIDSIVVSVGLIRTKTFTNLPELTGNGLDVGNLQMQISCPDIQTIEYGGKTYHTVQIGNQCWLKENLDIGKFVLASTVPVNDNILDKFCFNDDTLNCNNYGGLYRWHEAMKYTGIKEGNTGICPEGWHIPKQSEITELRTIIGESANPLVDERYINATNTSRFSALLGGIIKNGNSLVNGTMTDFWMSTNKYLQINKYNNNYFFKELVAETEDGFSVRCINGALPPVPTPISPYNNYKLVPKIAKLKWVKVNEAATYDLQVSLYSDFSYINYNLNLTNLETDSTEVTLLCPKIYYWRVRAKNSLGTSSWSAIYQFGTICDSIGKPCPGAETVVYEGRIYHTVQIGNTCWFKENLDVGEMIPSTQTQQNNVIIEKYCYNNIAANCADYGGLYFWKEAMQYTTTSAQGTQGICPNGWQIASGNIMADFAEKVGGNTSTVLLAGNNITGFSAKLGGYYENGSFAGMGDKAVIWSSFGFSPDGTLVTFFLKINPTVSYTYGSPWMANSVRCTKPAP
ncbi:MAG: FISUMP domain-containing protein [bacterium]